MAAGAANGTWAILGDLASGGMARVQLARLTGADGVAHVLAVKRLHRHLASEERFVTMFLDEAWMTAGLHHPNVVELLGWGEDDAGMFLALELVNGAPLGHIARSGRAAGVPIAPELIAHAGARIAEGLAAAHARKAPDGTSLCLVHRDLTPSNVLVGFDGSVKITDFGVAHAVGRMTKTTSGVLKGKIAYMSPEQARGAGVDGRSDLHALGVVLFELAAGQPPFEAETEHDLLQLVLEKPAPPVRDKAPEIDVSLATVIDRLLAKDPGRRPAEGMEVARALDACAAASRKPIATLTEMLARYAGAFGRAQRGKLMHLAAQTGTPSELRFLRDDPPPRPTPPPPRDAPTQPERASTRKIERRPVARTEDTGTVVMPDRPRDPVVAGISNTPTISEPPRIVEVATASTGAPKAALVPIDSVTHVLSPSAKHGRAGLPWKKLLGVAALSFVTVAFVLSLVLGWMTLHR